MMKKIVTFMDWLINRFVMEEKVFRNPLFKIPLKGLQLFGYMISADQWVWKPHCFRGTVFTISFVLFNVTQYIDLYQKWGNLDDMMQNASTTLLFTTTAIRMFSFYWNRSRYLNVVKEADDELSLILSTKNDREKEIIANYIKYFRFLATGFIMIAVITANGMNFYSLIQSFFYEPRPNSHPPTILRSYFPTDDIWRDFYKIYVFQFYIMWVGIVIVASWHTFILSLLCYCIAMLRLLNHKFESFDEYVLESLPMEVQNVVWKHREYKKRATIEEYDKKAIEIFEKLMEEHRKVLKFVKEVSNLMAIYVFGDFIIFSILICALLFQTSTTSDNIQKILGVCYIVTMTVILWIHYWHANEIKFYDSELSKSLFRSNWYVQSMEFKKMFLMFSQMNTPPLKIRAGALVITLDVFLNIFRASYSYFTLLIQLKG